MSKGNVFENDLMKLIFNGTAIALIADNAATTPLTNLFLALHTADPGEAGDQTTTECAYVGYARTAVARTTGGWTVTDNAAVPVADIVFPAAEAGTTPESATHASVGTVVSGVGKILYKGAITPPIAISEGVTPRLTSSNTSITED